MKKTAWLIIICLVFSFIPVTSIAHGGATYQVTVYTLKNAYNIGEEVQINGTVTHNGKGVAGSELALKVTSSDGSILYFIDQPVTDADGKYVSKFILPSHIKTNGLVTVKFIDQKATTTVTLSGGTAVAPVPTTPPPMGGFPVGDIPLLVITEPIEDLLEDEPAEENKIPSSELEKVTVNGVEVLRYNVTLESLEKQNNKDSQVTISSKVDQIFLPLQVIEQIKKDSTNIILALSNVTVKVPVESLSMHSQVFNIKEETSNLKTVKLTHQIYRNNTYQSVANSEKNYTVELKIDANKLNQVDKRKVGVYLIDEKTNKETYLGGILRKDNTIEVATKELGKFVVRENIKTFVDLNTSKWAQEEIEVLAARHIIGGMSETQFSPNNNINRAQFAVLISRMLNLPLESTTGSFKDVSNNVWYAKEVEALNKANIIKGSGEGVFEPNRPITRQEMATIMVRVLEFKGQTLNKGNNGNFADAENISPFAKEAVAIAVNHGIIKGRPNNQFAPKDLATRAEAAVMLYRLLNDLGELPNK